MLRRSRSLAGVVALSVGVICSGTAGAWAISASRGNDAASSNFTPVTYASETSAERLGESADQAVSDTLAGLDPVLERAEVLPSPTGGGAEIFRVVLAGSDTNDYLSSKEIWEADLAQGAIAEQMDSGQQDLDDVISSTALHFASPGDLNRPITGGAGAVQAGQIYPDQISKLSDDDIMTRARDFLDENGAEVTDIGVVHPLGPALYVRATVASIETVTSYPGGFAGLELGLVGKSHYNEGLLFEIDLPDGTVVARGSSAFRVGGSRSYTNGSIKGNLGVLHG